jgi:hypothetical protein
MRDALDPPDFRWHVETALDARAAHDQGDQLAVTEDGAQDADDSSYPTLAVLLRTRMAALPAPTKAPAPHGGGNRAAGPNASQMLAQLAEQAPFGRAGLPSATRTRPLPAKRKKSDRPAPGYQVKVSLRGAKPPIGGASRYPLTSPWPGCTTSFRSHSAGTTTTCTPTPRRTATSERPIPNSGTGPRHP